MVNVADGARNQAVVLGLALATFAGTHVKFGERWHVAGGEYVVNWLAEEIYCD